MPYESVEARRKYQRDYYKKHVRPNRQKLKIDAGTERKVVVNTRLPVALIGRLQRVVNEGIATGRFPWKTMSACIAAMIIKGFESMQGDESIDEMLPYLRAINMIEHVGQHRTEAMAAMSKIKTEVSELLNIKARDEAVQYFHGMYEAVEDMNANVWRDWLLKELERAFPDLLKEKPKGVSFIDKHTLKKERRVSRDRRQQREEDARQDAKKARASARIQKKVVIRGPGRPRRAARHAH